MQEKPDHNLIKIDLTNYNFKDSPQSFHIQKFRVWIISQNDEIVRIVLDKCAHMGNSLTVTRSGFLCPRHNWTYDKVGNNDIRSNPSLETISFEVDNNELTFRIPDNVNLLPWDGKTLDGSESLQLISHACFQLTSDATTVLFDPWIIGEAYFGSWGLFPQYHLDLTAITHPNYIVITHPHPDHFHPETLELFPRSTKIFIPPFISQIMPKILARMGFSNVEELQWEEKRELENGISFAFLRPNSGWEDSAVLVRVKNWTWLNQNDAGSTLRSDVLPATLDLLTTSFDSGASGYPLTWIMPEEKKAKIMQNKKKQTIASILERCTEVQATHFASFASYWRHVDPTHQKYDKSINHTSIEDLEMAFLDHKTRFIPTIPSSNLRLIDYAHEYQPHVRAALSSSPKLKPCHHNLAISASEESLILQLTRKIELLQKMSSATNCEHVIFHVKVEGIDKLISTHFGNTEEPVLTSITVSISQGVAHIMAFGDEQATWNHIEIGYWGTWTRTPDIYPMNFMRLLHLGYVEPLSSPSFNDAFAKDFLIADILEADPDVAFRLFGRAGLPCVSCQYSTSETLENALRIHRISENSAVRLRHEISSLMRSQGENI